MAPAKRSFEKQENNISKVEKKKGPVESVILKVPNNSTMKIKEQAAGSAIVKSSPILFLYVAQDKKKQGKEMKT
eukprot:398152-Ditylum_brightwellii.AAC.1